MQDPEESWRSWVLRDPGGRDRKQEGLVPRNMGSTGDLELMDRGETPNSGHWGVICIARINFVTLPPCPLLP